MAYKNTIASITYPSKQRNVISKFHDTYSKYVAVDVQNSTVFWSDYSKMEKLVKMASLDIRSEEPKFLNEQIIIDSNI